MAEREANCGDRHSAAGDVVGRQRRALFDPNNLVEAWLRRSFGHRMGAVRRQRGHLAHHAILDRFGVPGTFCPNSQSAKLYEKAIRQAIKSGHEVAGHGNFQDQLMVYMETDAEQALIRQSLDLLAQVTGERPKGWCSPVLAWSENTFDLLVQEGLLWHGEAKDFSMPRKITTKSGSLIALPVSDFADNRVLRASPLDFHDVYRETFDYLYAHEPMAMLPIAMHCHWGGRPLMAAMLQKILNYYCQFYDVWFARSSEIAQWMIKQKVDDVPYNQRFFA